MLENLFYLLSRHARETSLVELQLGELGQTLQLREIDSIGTLLVRALMSKRDLEGLGLQAQETSFLRRRLKLISKSLLANGDINWNAYEACCASSKEPIAIEADLHEKLVTVDPPAPNVIVAPPIKSIPTFEVRNGVEFINALPEVISEIILSREKEIDRVLLSERLAKHPHERMTLEEVAKSLKKKVTRERIRQRETIVLNELSQSLLFNRGRRLGLYFSQSFRSYWVRAHEAFKGQHAVTFEQFMETLCSSWEVAPHRIFAYLPLITSILTSKATIPEAIRGSLRRDPKLFEEFDADSCQVSIRRLPIGWLARDLTRSGIETVGDFIEHARKGRALTGNSRSVDHLIDALIAARDESGCVDMEKVFLSFGLAATPARDPECAAQFLDGLLSDVRSIVQENMFTKRSLQIFDLRIAVSHRRRPTLAEVASQLGTHGPSIKREESVLLEELNRQLVEQDYTHAKALVRPRFASYWQQAAAAYHNCGGDYSAFCQLATTTWGAHFPEAVAEILWAVVSEYPRHGKGRASDGRPSRPISASAASVGKIVLRGFRSVH
jgi:hypothetical protein